VEQTVTRTNVDDGEQREQNQNKGKQQVRKEKGRKEPSGKKRRKQKQNHGYVSSLTIREEGDLVTHPLVKANPQLFGLNKFVAQDLSVPPGFGSRGTRGAASNFRPFQVSLCTLEMWSDP
jgi:hypothetical protein